MIEALAFPFMQKALLAAMVTGSVCAVLCAWGMVRHEAKATATP